MHKNAKLIETFYTAFQNRDWVGMAACYHPEAHFTDPAFDLRGKEPGAMWHMLVSRGKDTVVEYSGVWADDATGRAHWEAHYTFGPTKQKVHNIIDAEFQFKDGKILRHVDTFDFHRWAGQAMGLPGKVLGRFGFFQKQLGKVAAKQLAAFIAKRPEYQ